MEEHKRIKAVIFDIDNTLYSYDENHIDGMKALEDYCKSAFQITREEMELYYKKAGQILNERIGSDMAAIHNRLLRIQCMLELIDQPLFPHALHMYHAYWDTLILHSKPTKGAIEFIKELKKRNIRIGMGTDMTAYIQYKKLEALGIAPYIDYIVTSEEAGVEKPHPHFFELCVQKANARAEECAFIGDSLKKDVEGACKNGLKGIWYTRGEELGEDIEYPKIRTFEDVNIDYMFPKD